ncbi:MAG TPA: hypothetical protein VH041_18690 [Caldimonas sp.]|nr:hypothetical protein [Caldimonas sp.]HEX4236321.1 hypothetical protein [Caldimonas sp.]
MLSIALAAVPALAATGSTEVVQQRLSDGRILLTDRPVRGATTERSWQMSNEDPAAARERAAAVSSEAAQVSERVQRMIEQDRRTDIERERTRLAALAMTQQQRDDEPVYYGGVVPYGYGTGLASGRGHGHGHVGHHDKFPHTDRWGVTERFGTVGKFGAGTGPQSMR